MRITILAVGRIKDGAERELVNRYLDRARAVGRGQGFSGFEVIELSESRATRAADRKTAESRELLARAENSLLVVLDESGVSPTSEHFAALQEKWRDTGTKSLIFVIGGADGHDPSLLAKAELRMAFGAMTLPHQLARILLSEQLYRAMTVLAGHPYHRA